VPENEEVVVLPRPLARISRDLELIGALAVAYVAALERAT
jgi:hypothetical protein